ncbi:hypothetical protein WMY93_008863 [Mugilogobius chulae]|uniref:Apple domain-containing protein n=1 Tax=Mugilogobius chulae TaxID=88201 RepID=A0AAW0PA61_9GOBI
MDPRLTLVVISSCIALCLGCTKELSVGELFYGSVIETKSSPSAKHCQILCTYELRCAIFTFSNFKCELKRDDSGAIRAVSSSIISGRSLFSCAAEKKEACFRDEYSQVAFKDKPYQTVRTTNEKECRSKCDNDPLCSFYTFYKSSAQCELKFWNLLPTAEVLYSSTGNLVSGYSSKLKLNINAKYNCLSIQSKGYLLENDYFDYTYSGAAFTVEHCQTLCNLNPFCRVYAYRTNGHCRLKLIKDSHTQGAKLDYVISGLRQTDCKPNFVGKKTTATT